MRVVVDPGVLVSALIGQKASPYRLLRAWVAREFELVVFPKLLGELETVLLRLQFRRYASLDEVVDYVDEFRRATLVDDPVDVPVGLTRDPKDDYLIALARAAGADLIVSGDKHLTGLPGVVTPRELVELLQSA